MSRMVHSRPIGRHVLLVEDDAVDAMAVRRIFEQAGAVGGLVAAGDGSEALGMLLGEDGEAPSPLPRLILLDLRLPKIDGIEFLRIIRSSDDDHIRSLPVIVLTSSNLPKDRKLTNALGVSGYFVKGIESDELVKFLAEDFRYPGSA